VHLLGTCQRRTAELKRLLAKNAFRPQDKSDFAIAQKKKKRGKKTERKEI